MALEIFDTHACIKQLSASGVPDAQAEAFAALRLELVRFSFDVDERFTAVDRRFDAVDRRFDAFERRFDAIDRRFDAFESQVDKKLEVMRAYMIKWMFGFFVTQFAATFTMIRFMT